MLVDFSALVHPVNLFIPSYPVLIRTNLGNRGIEPEIRGREEVEPGIGQVLCSTLSVVP